MICEISTINKNTNFNSGYRILKANQKAWEKIPSRKFANNGIHIKHLLRDVKHGGFHFVSQRSTELAMLDVYGIY